MMARLFKYIYFWQIDPLHVNGCTNPTFNALNRLTSQVKNDELLGTLVLVFLYFS